MYENIFLFFENLEVNAIISSHIYDLFCEPENPINILLMYVNEKMLCLASMESYFSQPQSAKLVSLHKFHIHKINATAAFCIIDLPIIY